MLASASIACLALVSAQPRLAVDLRLAAPGTWALEGAAGVPDLAIPSPPAPSSPGVQAGAVAGAAAGIALADLLSATLVVAATLNSCFMENCPAPAWVVPAFLLGLGSYLFLPPAMGVWFARSAYGGNDPGRAYWLSFALRLGAMGLLGAGRVGAALYLAEELVLAPYVIARALGAPPARTVALAAIPVRPERDPAMPLGR